MCVELYKPGSVIQMNDESLILEPKRLIMQPTLAFIEKNICIAALANLVLLLVGFTMHLAIACQIGGLLPHHFTLTL